MRRALVVLFASLGLLLPTAALAVPAAEIVSAGERGVHLGTLKHPERGELRLVCRAAKKRLACAAFDAKGKRLALAVTRTKDGVRFDAGDGVSRAIGVGDVARFQKVLSGADALAYIEEVWTDMRPLSVKAATQKTTKK